MTTALTSPSDSAARWFRRVTWLGILFNLLFVAGALAAPDFINASLDLPITGSTMWNTAHAAMVLALTLLYIPAAVSPLRFPAYTWMIVVSRLVAVVVWGFLSRSYPGFLQCLVPDAVFGVAEGILLQLALPEESRISAGNLGRAFTGLWQGTLASLRLTRVRVALGVVVVALLGAGYFLWYNLLRAEPEIQYADAAQHYMHGAIGLSTGSRVPYWIWKVLPTMFPEKLPGPGGWASVGLLMQNGQDLPVGFSKRTIGYESVEPNCSLCHVGQFRRTPGGKPELILGGPANLLDLQAMQRFLYNSAADPRFNSGNVIAAIDRIHKLGPVDSLLYRFILIPAAKQGLVENKIAYAWQDSRPTQGPGRTDTFNPTKINVFHMPDDGTIGTVDLPQVWNQKPREGMQLHWDGNNNNLQERNFAAAMAIGATPKSVIQSSFKRVTDFLLTLQPPAYPFPIDKASAARGQVIFASACAGCHAFGGSKTGTVTDISQVGTDRHRLDSFTPALVARFHQIDSPPFVFDAYRKTDGYANLPLDGVWARAPYLHNGSVPNLRTLLLPVDQRPTTFYRAYDVYDPVNVGFVSDGPDAQKAGFLVNTHVAGNSNQGHTYGVDLSDAQKKDLIEYLKTL